MNRKQYVYRTNDSGGCTKSGTGRTPSVIRQAGTRERAEQLAWRI